jgi:hypothetical protein
MNEKILMKFCTAVIVSSLSLAHGQSSGAPPAASAPLLSGRDDSSALLLVPPPVSGSSYSLAFVSEERSNYLKGGVTFQANHDDDVITTPSGSPVADWSYSIWPSIEINQTWPRFHWRVAYMPGFTFYQNLSSYNQQDHNLSISGEYRLSPHVTLGLRDSLQRTSNLFNQPAFGSEGTIGGAPQGPNNSIVTPVSDVLRNTAGGDLTYQYGRNDMVGVGGTVTNLHFLNASQDQGLYDAAARGGSAFYTHRFAARHYVGVSYFYQQLLTYPAGPQNQTITNTVIGFYTFYPRRTLSFSLFGGPQHASTQQFGTPAVEQWSPAAGASVGWQGRHTSAAVSYLYTISDGGGLVGAVHSNAGAITLRQQLTRAWSLGASGTYADNTLVESAAATDLNDSGHTLGGSVSVQRTIGEHFSAQVGYSHLHQDYDNVAALATVTGRNREWMAVTYNFTRPLGR